MLDSGNGYGNEVHGNRILDRLPADDRAIMSAKLSPVFLRVKTVLFEPGEVVDAVYFPLDGVISLVTPLEDGAIVEVATIGNEGLVGVPSIPGGPCQFVPYRRWRAAASPCRWRPSATRQLPVPRSSSWFRHTWSHSSARFPTRPHATGCIPMRSD